MGILEVSSWAGSGSGAWDANGCRHHHDQELVRARRSEPCLLAVQGRYLGRAFEDGICA